MRQGGSPANPHRTATTTAMTVATNALLSRMYTSDSMKSQSPHGVHGRYQWTALPRHLPASEGGNAAMLFSEFVDRVLAIDLIQECRFRNQARRRSPEVPAGLPSVRSLALAPGASRVA